MKKTIFILTAFLIMLTTSCFASTDAGFKAKSEKVNSIQEILDSLPKYENQGKVKVTYKGAFEIG